MGKRAPIAGGPSCRVKGPLAGGPRWPFVPLPSARPPRRGLLPSHPPWTGCHLPSRRPRSGNCRRQPTPCRPARNQRKGTNPSGLCPRKRNKSPQHESEHHLDWGFTSTNHFCSSPIKIHDHIGLCQRFLMKMSGSCQVMRTKKVQPS